MSPAPVMTRRLAKAAQRRALAVDFIHLLGPALALAALIDTGLIIAARFILLRLPSQTWITLLIAIPAAAILLSAMLAWLRRWPELRAASAIDQRLGLKDRLSSALALATSDAPRAAPAGPFAPLAINDAETLAPTLTLAKAFPLRFGKPWLAAAIITLLAAAAWFIPQRIDQTTTIQRQQLAARQDAAQAVTQVAESARELVSQSSLDESRAAAAQRRLDQLDEITKELASPRATKPAAEALAESSRQIEDIAGELASRSEEESQRIREARRQLAQAARQAASPASPAGSAASQDFSRAIREGDLDAARDAAQALADHAKELGPAEREALADELDRMVQQLEAQNQQQAQADRKSTPATSEPTAVDPKTTAETNSSPPTSSGRDDQNSPQPNPSAPPPDTQDPATKPAPSKPSDADPPTKQQDPPRPGSEPQPNPEPKPSADADGKPASTPSDQKESPQSGQTAKDRAATADGKTDGKPEAKNQDKPEDKNEPSRNPEAGPGQKESPKEDTSESPKSDQAATEKSTERTPDPTGSKPDQPVRKADGNPTDPQKKPEDQPQRPDATRGIREAMKEAADGLRGDQKKSPDTPPPGKESQQGDRKNSEQETPSQDAKSTTPPGAQEKPAVSPQDQKPSQNQKPGPSKPEQPSSSPSPAPSAPKDTPASDPPQPPDPSAPKEGGEPTLPDLKGLEKLAKEFEKLGDKGRDALRDQKMSESLRKQAEDLLRRATPEQRQQLEKLAREMAKRQPGDQSPGEPPQPDQTANQPDPKQGDTPGSKPGEQDNAAKDRRSQDPRKNGNPSPGPEGQRPGAKESAPPGEPSLDNPSSPSGDRSGAPNTGGDDPTGNAPRAPRSARPATEFGDVTSRPDTLDARRSAPANGGERPITEIPKILGDAPLARSPVGVSAASAREAARGVERALEQQSIPTRHTDLIRRIFHRITERAGARTAAGASPGTTAPPPPPATDAVDAQDAPRR